MNRKKINLDYLRNAILNDFIPVVSNTNMDKQGELGPAKLQRSNYESALSYYDEFIATAEPKVVSQVRELAESLPELPSICDDSSGNVIEGNHGIPGEEEFYETIFSSKEKFAKYISRA